LSIIILIIIVLTAILIFNKQNNLKSTENGKITIITSIYPVYDFTKELVGDKANVEMIISPGVEIHDFEPTPQDIIKIQNANLFLYTGEDLEPWASTIISGIDNKSNIRNVAQGIQLIENQEHEEDHSTKHEEHEKYDTHIWLDVQKSIQIVENIKQELCKEDEKNSAYYKTKADEYIAKLRTLDQEIEKTISENPNKKIAFGGPFSYTYFIKRYNIKYISAYDSCGENNEPSIEKISEVIKEIEKEKIPVIFYKELSSGNIATTISNETGSKKMLFHSLHSISKQELENGASYLSIMYQNLENLKKALQ